MMRRIDGLYMNSRKKIVVFYFPFRIVSGGPIFLSNLAIGLSKNTSFSVYYIDYNDGAAQEILLGTEVNILEYRDERSFELFIEHEIYLVTPIYWGDRVPVLNQNSKILFLNWHNLCIPSLKSGLRCDDETLTGLLSLISDNDAEFYCDKAHWDAQEVYGVKFREIYVPITIPERKEILSKDLVDPNVINIAVVGRLVIDKVYAITDLIDNIIEDYQPGNTINIYVIGDGDSKKLLVNYPKPDYINLLFCGTLRIDEINNVLSTKVDILFAMGTSVLEGASAGLPSVIIPNDVKTFHCNRYTYLYECNSFLLGWGPDQIDLFDIKTHTVGEIFNDIYKKNRKREIGELCQQYYRINHSDNNKFFLRALEGTTLKYADFDKEILFIRDTVKERYRNNINQFMKNVNNRDKVIWGAGKRGIELLGFLNEINIKIEFFVDKKADLLKEIEKIPVKKPTFLNVKKHLVMVSLANYISDIPEELERRGFKKGIDYLYVYYQEQ